MSLASVRTIFLLCLHPPRAHLCPADTSVGSPGEPTALQLSLLLLQWPYHLATCPVWNPCGVFLPSVTPRHTATRGQMYVQVVHARVGHVDTHTGRRPQPPRCWDFRHAPPRLTVAVRSFPSHHTALFFGVLSLLSNSQGTPTAYWTGQKSLGPT